jgi:NADPH2:quinone reductase
MMYKDLTVRMVIVYAMPEAAKEQAILDIEEALTASRLQHRIAEVLPLDEIAAANERIENGNVRGAIILSID